MSIGFGTIVVLGLLIAVLLIGSKVRKHAQQLKALEKEAQK